jgi:hypothetical protein
MVLIFFISFTVLARNDLGLLLNKITLQLRSEQWVVTQTAVVQLKVNAIVSDQNVGNIQVKLMDQLKKISDQAWHVVSFNRHLDQSGLENIQILAEARLPQTDLAGLREKAKGISKPGETFTVQDVQFTPSDAEIRLANEALRGKIYEQAKVEINRLNQLYPDQHYYLYQIDFLTEQPVTMMVRQTAAKQSVEPIAVGNKVYLQANVVIASMSHALERGAQGDKE